MRITRISTAVVEANFDWTIVRLDTDEGITGYGEAFLGPGLTAVIREFAVALVGEDPTSIDRVMRRLRAACVHASPGLVYHALAGIEGALLDLIGKRHRMPMWQILGGKYRDEILIYADCHAGEALESLGPLVNPRVPRWMVEQQGEVPERSIVSVKHHGWDAGKEQQIEPDAYAARAREMLARGFRVLKFDIDVPMPYETDEYNRHLSHEELDFAESLIASVRATVGNEVEIAVDCHWNYSVESAAQLARAFEPYRLLWLEDPIPPENIAAFRRVQQSTVTPITTGENHYFRIDFERLIVEGGLRLLAPDVQKIGFWEGRKIADMADVHYVNLAPHNISGPLGTMAAAHLCAAIPNFVALEWHAASVPFFDQLVKGAGEPMIRRGKVQVSDAPGAGVELDLDVAYKYRKAGEPFFE